ncbi:hypothetical protein KFK09_026702 [Dendrobium nobile]|uniref:Uncharacterized protein n=1 Tax=Dendrobium nobile TaxID=94219 RepID=A0A8T3A8A1_DENNO|nr:hypothetical protein KFK09_026702 [Dendrobium nobile]
MEPLIYSRPFSHLSHIMLAHEATILTILLQVLFATIIDKKNLFDIGFDCH